MKIITGKMIGKGLNCGVVVSRFNEFISGKLLDGCLDVLLRHEVEEKNIEVVWAQGAFELPGVFKKLALQKKYDVIICLGTVIRGDTPHFDYVAGEVSKGVASVSLETGVPVVFGVVTTDNIEQAIERAGTKSGNKGADAARTAIELAQLYKQL